MQVSVCLVMMPCLIYVSPKVLFFYTSRQYKSKSGMHTTQSRHTAALQPSLLFTQILQCFERGQEMAQERKAILMSVSQSMQQNQQEIKYINQKKKQQDNTRFIYYSTLMPASSLHPPPTTLQQFLLTAQWKRSSHLSYSLTGLSIQQHGVFLHLFDTMQLDRFYTDGLKMHLYGSKINKKPWPFVWERLLFYC